MIQLEIYRLKIEIGAWAEGKFTNELQKPNEDENVLLMMRNSDGYWLYWLLRLLADAFAYP
jgi:hypothetical protein